MERNQVSKSRKIEYYEDEEWELDDERDKEREKQARRERARDKKQKRESVYRDWNDGDING